MQWLIDILKEWLELYLQGMIVLWSGAIVNIPAGWQLCDGTNGTPDLRNRFIPGAGDTYDPGDTGGSDLGTHTHTSPPHGHNQTSHSHTVDSHYHSHNHGIQHTWTNPDWEYATAGAVAVAPRYHLHAFDIDAIDSDSKTPGTDSKAPNILNTAALISAAYPNNRPKYYALAYIMKV